jgi:predicted nucleic acid-binding protein
VHLIDTSVLIDYLRDRGEAVRFLESLEPPLLISAMTVAELYAGVREGDERLCLEAFLRSFSVIPVTASLAQAGGVYRRIYGSSHGTDLIDGILAATATEQQARLVTLNRKHFPMLPGLLVPYGPAKR